MLVAGPILACGDSDAPSSEQPETPRAELTIPARESTDPELPDSCELLVAGDPRSMIDEELTPLQRMSDLCLVAAKSAATLERSITLEVRKPSELEKQRLPEGVPTNEEQFWLNEGGGIDLVGGRRDQIKEVQGLGDYSVWYPITDGMALHAYWDGKYMLAINVRGVDMNRSVAWAQEVAQQAIQATTGLKEERPA